ncbi:hypothetical protein ACZ90_19020 [Streptomyces albus subsp. albus]|nr:hypothetical protein ACZ90_19020 [Streptomyces albus subsp. albus]
MESLGLEVVAAVGVVSRLVTRHHGLQSFAVVDVGRVDQMRNRRWAVDFEMPKHGGKALQAQPLTST